MFQNHWQHCDFLTPRSNINKDCHTEDEIFLSALSIVAQADYEYLWDIKASYYCFVKASKITLETVIGVTLTRL